MEITGFSEKQQKILQFLVKEKEGMTVEQFSKLLNISKSAIHQHLTILDRDGFIKKAASLQTGGRPGTRFVLTDKGIHIFPKHYNLIAKMLINLIKQKLGSEELSNYLKELGVSIADSKKNLMVGKSIEEKVEVTVAIMEELGYEAQLSETEENKDHLTIDAFNCVFHDIAQTNNEVCEMDLSLLSQLLDRKIEHSHCLAKGACKCSFVIPKK